MIAIVATTYFVLPFAIHKPTGKCTWHRFMSFHEAAY